jgi:hypothetical protein
MVPRGSSTRKLNRRRLAGSRQAATAMTRMGAGFGPALLQARRFTLR